MFIKQCREFKLKVIQIISRKSLFLLLRVNVLSEMFLFAQNILQRFARKPPRKHFSEHFFIFPGKYVGLARKQARHIPSKRMAEKKPRFPCGFFPGNGRERGLCRAQRLAYGFACLFSHSPLHPPSVRRPFPRRPSPRRPSRLLSFPPRPALWRSPPGPSQVQTR